MMVARYNATGYDPSMTAQHGGAWVRYSDYRDLEQRFDLELDAYAKDSDIATLSARVAQLEEALRLADEWMCCVEPHLRDTAGFKRDREVIRAALSEKEARG